MVVILELINHR